MKRVFVALIFMALTLPSRLNAAGVTVDPALTAAVLAQTAMLKSEYEKRSRRHSAIEVAQAAITVAMDNVHKVEGPY